MIYGYFASFFIAIQLIPQIVKMIKNKSAKDVSFVMLSISLIGSLLWIMYGVEIKSNPIIITNTITTFTSILSLYLKTKY